MKERRKEIGGNMRSNKENKYRINWMNGNKGRIKE